MRLYSFRFGFLLLFACIASVTWIKSNPENGAGATAQPGLRTLYERLQVAEDLGGQVSRDLLGLLEQLRNKSTPTDTTTNSTVSSQPQTHNYSQESILQPNIYLYMPHLRQQPDGLKANVLLGRGRRGVSMVLGVPTVKRDKQSYLINTLSSLLYGLRPPQQKDLLIIVFVAETDLDYVSEVAETIKKNFPDEVTSGLLEVVSPPLNFYPDFSSIAETFGDSRERVKWRTKQNLDFSFLMLYAHNKGTYYVQLEDDVVAKVDYYSQMKTFSSQQEANEWLYLEFSQLGFIGKMFRTRDLSMVAEFFLMFHRDKPIDWLLDHILWVKVCSPERDAKHCSEQKSLLKKRFKPSLFQHVGLHSSLPGKLQRLKDKDFGKQILFQAHVNPPAELSSSLTHYQQHSLDQVYRGLDFFWALSPVQGDYVLFRFPQPVQITRFLFRSGNIETRGDKLSNTSVEVLPSHVEARVSKPIASSSSDEGFVVVGWFENGVASGQVGAELQPAAALRLLVHADSDYWALISEIHIQV